MIVASPTRMLSRHYRVETPAGPWTELRFDDHAADAWFLVDGRSYRARRTPGESAWRDIVRTLRGRALYHLEEDGVVVARASGGGLRARYQIWTDAGPEYGLREDGKLVQLVRDGVPLGRLGRRSGLSRGLWAELSADVPAPVALFSIWLLLCRWETLHSA